jgi:AcrR family transcriptional regulator
MSSDATPGVRRSGRRPGDSGTREAILAAARVRFAAQGYAGSTLRAIAADAQVDQKLIAHFFGSKQALFLAAVGLPVNPVEILPRVLAGADRAAVIERLARELTAVLERPELAQRLAAVIRASASEPEVAQMLRDFFPGQLLEATRGLLGPGDSRLRLNLFGSQIVGLVMLRAIVGAEPLASAPARAIADAVAPTLARYLIGPLDSGNG